MEIVYRASDAIEANLIQGLLQQQGIDAYINGELLQGAVGEMAAANFINIMVDNSDAEKAKAIIETYDESYQGDEYGPGKMHLGNWFYILFIVAVFMTAAAFLLS